MPNKSTKRKAASDKRRGKKATTQAGHFVKEEMDHKKSGKHRVKNRKQAIAIGLSKARKAGVKVPKKKSSSAGRKKSASSSSGRTKSGSHRSTAARRGSSGTRRTKSGSRRTSHSSHKSH